MALAHDLMSTPQKVPLPPSPPVTSHQTPGLGIDQALTPRADLLLTPESRGPRDEFGIPILRTPTAWDTPTKPTSGRRDELGREELGGGAGAGAGKRRQAVLEDFELIRVVGKGCAGRVMMVRHTATATVHAMKAISKRSVLTHDELPHTVTEVSIMKHFAKYEPENQFIAKLHWAFTDKENIYFVMQFYPGGDLATQMEIESPLGPHRTRFYACDIVMALEDVHRHGVVVRDLKPENILLDSKGHAVLVDFGLSKHFGYRGQPAALHVPQFPGQPVVPYWAGAGAGSVRPGKNGQPKVTVDRTYSFVGTAEYLSPEVVRQGEHSYAVDWWALGCIMVEALVGRVPFRKEEWEEPLVLWDQIVSDPWHNVLRDPRIRAVPLEEYGLDAVTCEFIDGLLQKDPLMRLTEPHVRSHPYFTYIEWDLVRHAEYEDPHGLYLHNDLELNTAYFPKLCLDETPSVDMASHDLSRADPSEKPTPLNDDSLFAWEQLKAKQEFAQFSWSRDDHSIDESDHGHGQQQEVASLFTRSEDEIPHASDYGDLLAPEVDGDPLTWSVSEHTEQMHDTAGDGQSAAESEQAEQPSVVRSQTPAVEPSSSSMRAASLSTPLSPASRPLPPSPVVSPATAPPSPSPRIEQGTALPPLSPVDSLSRAPLPQSSPKAIGVPSPRNKRNLHLPSGLPSTGLSSSDIVTVPSPDMASPSRLIRRHTAAKPSVDTTANSRLSVDLGGTISRLGDDDWEQLETTSASAIPSVPNAAPSAFFTRGFGTVLRRRPSTTLGASGLRRQTKTSNSSHESGSPTKRRPLLSVKSIENTKKAFKKAFPFPKLRRDSKAKDPPVTADPSASGSGARGNRMASPSPPTLPRPNLAKRSNTESTSVSLSAPNTAHPASSSSWFSTRKIKRSNKTSKAYSSSSSDSVATGQLNLGPGGLPRVELTHTPPIVWELDKGGKTSPKTSGAPLVETEGPSDKSRVDALAPRPENKPDDQAPQTTHEPEEGKAKETIKSA